MSLTEKFLWYINYLCIADFQFNLKKKFHVIFCLSAVSSVLWENYYFFLLYEIFPFSNFLKWFCQRKELRCRWCWLFEFSFDFSSDIWSFCKINNCLRRVTLDIGASKRKENREFDEIIQKSKEKLPTDILYWTQSYLDTIKPLSRLFVDKLKSKIR